MKKEETRLEMAHPWALNLENALAAMVRDPAIVGGLDPAHVANTPARVARMYREMFEGATRDPREVLTTTFPSDGDEMVSLYDMDFVSYCAHHLLPFYGKAHFAYIPNGRIIGLSKIPRLIKLLSARPQVQENLCAQIADSFMEIIQPRGVAVCLDAVHSCMFARGVKALANTRTTALRGIFLDQGHAKEEFMAAIQPKER